MYALKKRLQGLAKTVVDLVARYYSLSCSTGCAVVAYPGIINASSSDDGVNDGFISFHGRCISERFLGFDNKEVWYY